MAYLLDQSENEARSLDAARRKINQCNRLSELLYSMNKLALQYSVSHKPQYLVQFDDAMGESKSIIGALRTTLGKATDEVNKLNRVETDLDRAEQLARQGLALAAQAKPGEEYNALPFTLARDARAAADKLNSDLLAFIDTQRVIEDQGPKAEALVRSRVKITLFLFLGANCLAALIGARFFLQQIISRISLVVDNAHRLSQNQSLNEPQSGSDELVELDNVFHDMAVILTKQQDALKASEEATRHSEERIRRIIEMMPVGLIIIRKDAKEATIEYANPTLLRMLGLNEEETAGKPLSFLFQDERMPSIVEAVSFNKEESAGKIYDLSCREKSGHERFVEVTFSELKIKQDNRLLMSVLDVTERREMLKLRQAFVSMVSHELRTPLTAVHGFLTLLGMGTLGEVQESIKTSAHRAEANVVRLINLINDLLDIEKVESGRIELRIDKQNVSGMLQQSVDAIREFAEQRNVTIKVEDCQQAISCDAQRVVQVLINLLSNAIKHSPAEAEVLMRCEPVKENLRFWVIDHGRGIPKSQQALISKDSIKSTMRPAKKAPDLA